MLNPTHRLAIYVEQALGGEAAKMGIGVLRYSQNPIVCVIDSQFAGQTVRKAIGIHSEVPIVASIADAVKLGADVLVIGIAPSGGLIPPTWYPDLIAAWDGGLSIVNGLHDRLGQTIGERPKVREDQFVWDVRTEPSGISLGQGRAAELKNRRVLMVGTDMAVGKMTAGLELHQAALAKGVNACFVATGQIGMTITGRGMPLDAIRLDFTTGAIEDEVLAVAESELIIIEGQGSLLHPSSTATLPLLRGAMPTHLILCARAGQQAIRQLPEVPIPDPADGTKLLDFIKLYEDLSEMSGAFPRPKCVGVALNTFDFPEEEATKELARWEKLLGMPVVDPVRQGAGRLVDAVLV